MTSIAGVVFILLPFKLLQTQQNLIINQKLGGKALVFNGKNNHKHIHQQVAKKGYTYIFTNVKSAPSKKFK